MKTKFFLLALAATLSMQANADQLFRHTDNAVATAPTRSTINASDIPAGMARVSLEAHDVWGDGSGYQLLLDEDATAYGTIIPETGALSLYASVSDEVYGQFEYKIPWNADGSLYTENVVFDGIISLLIPAGTYDWCITNPEAGYAMWIASDFGNVNGRADDFVFEEGKEYAFSVFMTDYGYDGVDLVITDGEPVTPPTPTEKTQTPDGSYQVVAGQHEVVVTITPYEGVAYYRIIFTAPDGTVTEGDWMEYTDAFSVYEDGHYRVEFYAIADGKLPSDPGAVEFTVSPMTGIEEMTTGKTVAGVRYFNAVGQEMNQANGLTIVVTTYTDGTTSAVKVMK
jgi:hypothetical protein